MLNYLSISGLILIVTKNEEWTFWLLKILIEEITQSYHTKTMKGLIADIAVLRELLDQRAPEIVRHLDDIGMPFAVVTTKWFICMFAEVLPVETVLRIWDCLFLEGNKVFFLQKKTFFQENTKSFILQILFRTSITLFLQHKDEILDCDDINTLAQLLRSIVKDADATDCHDFIQNIFRVPGTLKRTEIERIRAQVSTRPS